MQVVILGMSEADTSWCAAKDVPLALIKEYDNRMQIDTVESALQLGGKKTITIQTHATPQSLALPPEKKTKSGYNQQGTKQLGMIVKTSSLLSLHFVLCLHSPLRLTHDDEQSLTCQTRKDKHQTK